ncbi:response regulator [Flavobacterium artemisiae]|uniref:Response regulator n=1 Tax=Flavobacterium artemisiae TaxID=2126556 RepID=A0ABW4HJ02_9FLAO
MKCFLIDDDQDDREIFSAALDAADPSCQCMTAESAESALRILDEEADYAPDFIFLDLNMPLMDGRACLAELRKRPKIDNITVIIYTTSSHSKDIEETRRLGASHYLVKPASFNGLVTFLKALLEGKNEIYEPAVQF